MSRDDDSSRLPEGMRRVGYDADTQVYTFQDADGSYWESAPGCEYGRLTRVGGSDEDDVNDTQPFLQNASAQPSPSWRSEMRPLLNFGVIIGVFLMGVIWLLYGSSSGNPVPELDCPVGSQVYRVQAGDTCWDLAQSHDATVDDLIQLNDGLDCKHLPIGQQICLPST
ncbi:hypothetical protein VHEMI00364 [[Torrubiella] hemipterigena]|uniref:LysM domain-containing protein n=1 Tax=[Torrubiella] hemipterigena TaxID=1531966 RepID=A0A0A1SQA6_9HYPO|nr:hypothetical protein VHEMI00364 [[Torrubiella] hemipterigena]